MLLRACHDEADKDAVEEIAELKMTLNLMPCSHKVVLVLDDVGQDLFIYY
jgi:hypothetical protein